MSRTHFGGFWWQSRPVRLAAAAVIGLWLSLAVLSPIWAQPWPDLIFSSDFPPFWTSGSLILDGMGSSLYDMDVQRSIQVALRLELGTSDAVRLSGGLNPFHNPPPLALIMAPFALLPLPDAYLAWLVVSSALTVVAVALPLWGRPGGWAATVLLLSYTAVFVSLVWGQVNSLFMLFLSGALVSMRCDRPWLAGALTGLLWLKPQFAILFPVIFLLKRRWREFAGMMVVLSALIGVSLIMVGPGEVFNYLRVLQRIGGYYPPVESAISPEIMVNWRGALMALLPELTSEQGMVLMTLLSVITVLLLLLVWSEPWDPNSAVFYYRVAALVLASAAVSPHSHFHGTALVAVPLAFAVSMCTGLQSQRLRLALTVLLYVAGFGLFAAVRTALWMLVLVFLLFISVLAKGSLSGRAASQLDPASADSHRNLSAMD